MTKYLLYVRKSTDEDGGKIIYLVDTGKIAALKFPTFWFENTPQGKFMLNIAFGQSKYFVDNLSENIQRGIREKLRRGEKSGIAPYGYLNDVRIKKIVKDPKIATMIENLFHAYATGDHSLNDLRTLSNSVGLVNRKNGLPLSLSEIVRILQNVVYYGMFIHRGEMFQGVHEPIVSPCPKFEEGIRCGQSQAGPTHELLFRRRFRA